MSEIVTQPDATRVAAPAPENRGARRSARRCGIIVLIVIVVGIALRVVALAHSPLWDDEIFSLAMATGHSLEGPAATADPNVGDYIETDAPQSVAHWRRYLSHDDPPADFSRVTRAVRVSDTSPPLYYLMLWGWTRALGTSDAALRGFSLLCFIASVPLIAALARRLGGRRARIIAVALFCLAPLSVYYSVEGRMYSLVLFEVLSIALLSLRIHEGSSRRAAIDWLLWTIVAAAGLLTHYFFAFPLAACGVWLMLYGRGVTRASLIGATVVVALLIAPWYLKVAAAHNAWRVTKDWLYWPPGERRIESAYKLPWSYAVPQGLWNGPRFVNRVAKLSFVLVSLAILWRWRGRRLRRGLFARRIQLLWLWVIAACAAPVVLDLVRHTYMSAVPRYAIAGLPAALVLLAVGLSKLRRPWRLASVVLIVLVWLPPLRAIAVQRGRTFQPVKDVARVVDAWTSDVSARPLVIVHSIPSGVLNVTRYLTRSNVEVYSWVGQLEQRDVDDLPRLCAGRSRVIVVDIHPVGDPPEAQHWLDAHAKLEQSRRLDNVTVTQYAPMKGGTF